MCCYSLAVFGTIFATSRLGVMAYAGDPGNFSLLGSLWECIPGGKVILETPRPFPVASGCLNGKEGVPRLGRGSARQRSGQGRQRFCPPLTERADGFRPLHGQSGAFDTSRHKEFPWQARLRSPRCRAAATTTSTSTALRRRWTIPRCWPGTSQIGISA